VLGMSDAFAKPAVQKDISASQPSEEEAFPSGPWMRVLAQTPLPSADRDLKSTIERYGRLCKPVPLAPTPDPAWLTAALMEEIPWFGGLIEAIDIDLLLARRLGRDHFHLPPLIIVGPPGVGKSYFLGRFAELSGVATGRLIAAGHADNRALQGTARGWATATPCWPLSVILGALVGNPILVVEEIDKVGGSDRNGRIADTLLALTDPALSGAWYDECLSVTANLSAVSWILTANHLYRVPAQLRSRCRIVQVPAPEPKHFDLIFRGVQRQLATEFGAELEVLPELDPEAIEAMRAGFSTGRLQARQVAALVRRAMAATAAAERAMLRH